MSADIDELASEIPPKVMCDRDECDHVGVTEFNGTRLYRPHEMEEKR